MDNIKQAQSLIARVRNPGQTYYIHTYMYVCRLRIHAYPLVFGSHFHDFVVVLKNASQINNPYWHSWYHATCEILDKVCSFENQNRPRWTILSEFGLSLCPDQASLQDFLAEQNNCGK